MKKSVRTLIDLKPSDDKAIRDAIAAGDYESRSEVITSAMSIWKRWKRSGDNRLKGYAYLHALYEEGMASGPATELDVDAFLAELRSAPGES